MPSSKFQRLFLQQYRELHEAPAPRKIMLTRSVKILIGSTIIVLIMLLVLLFLKNPFLSAMIPFAVGLVLGNSAADLGAVMRRAGAWPIVEQITNWEKVYALLDGKHTEKVDAGS